MVASAPSNFTEMVGMGVRDGRLTKGSTPSNNTKKFGSGHPKRKEHEVGMVTYNQPQPTYPLYPQVVAVTPPPQMPLPYRPPSHYPP
ncbi:hypothetical protein A2U01_0064364, partial [Trifolium medium]|nr:hypothetical protein [Trifolium medium]